MPLFVTFEGIEGAGKSTHLRALAVTLRARGHVVTETREPGGTAAGTAIRRLLLGPDAVPLTPLAEVLLVCADRAQHVAEAIRPALARGEVVLCDRFSDSTLAYQGHGRGLALATVRALDAAARDGLAPDLTILIDCPVAEGLRRIDHRQGAGDRFEREPLAFHERIRNGFRTIAAAEPERVHVVDGTPPPDVVQRAIETAVFARLGPPA